MQWIKFETSLLSDSRILALLADHSLKGFGVYTLIRLALGEHRTLTPLKLFAIVGEFTGRRMVRSILFNYGLFRLTAQGHIVLADPVLPHADARAEARAEARAQLRAEAHTGEPINPSKDIKNRKEEEIENDDDDDDDDPNDDDDHNHDDNDDHNDDEHPCPTDAQIAQVRDWLMSARSNSWREALLMQSGYGSLLQVYWAEAIDFFIMHSQSQDTLFTITNEHLARRYFTNFARLTIGSGKALHQHLTELSSKSGSASISAPVFDLPPTAPPRPSPSAIWNYATDQWVEEAKTPSAIMDYG